MNRKLTHALLAILILAPMTAAAATRLQPESVASTWSTGPYTYDGSGNVVVIGPQVTNEGSGKTDYYVYDAVGRLRNGTAHTPSSSNQQTFTYDLYGNLKQIETTTPGGTATATYALDPATNQLTDQTKCIIATTCYFATYDPATGDQLTSSSGVSTQWDVLGMMTTLDTATRHEWYVYDANNERVLVVHAPSSSAETRAYSLRGLDAKVQREIVDAVSGGAHHWSWQKDYVYAGSRLISSITPNTAGEVRRHFHPDHLGTPLLITDDRGFRLSLHKYSPFGGDAPGSDTDDERMKFTGHERDFGEGAGQDLDYMHARYYTPVMGRFLSVDPALETNKALNEPQRWNRYSYVTNNPTNSVDPTGRCSTAVMLAAFYMCGTLDLIDYVQERGGQTVDAVRGMGPSASAEENAMGAAVVGIVVLDIGANAIEPEQAALEKRLTNIFGKELTEATISAAAREVHGETVAVKSSGEAFNHISKMDNAMNGAKRALEALKKTAADSRLTESQRKQVTDALSKYSKKLDEVEKLFRNLLIYHRR